MDINSERISKSKEDILHDAIMHLDQVVKCSLEYDKGHRVSMSYVTTTLRALLKDNKRSKTKSVLTHLNLKSGKFIDIAGIGNTKSLIPIFKVKFYNSDFIPDLTTTDKNWIPFDDWYNGIVLSKNGMYQKTRKDVIIDLGEKYVQHVDKNVDRAFHQLFKNDPEYIGWNFEVNGILVKSTDFIHALIRMICHEIIVSFDEFKVLPIDFKSTYFDRLDEILIKRPFGSYDVVLHRVSDIVPYCFYTKDNISHKVGGEIRGHNKKIPSVQIFIENNIKKLIQEKVYCLIENNPANGEHNFEVSEFVEFEYGSLGVVDQMTQKFTYIDKMKLDFSFGVLVEKLTGDISAKLLYT